MLLEQILTSKLFSRHQEYLAGSGEFVGEPDAQSAETPGLMLYDLPTHKLHPLPVETHLGYCLEFGGMAGISHKMSICFASVTYFSPRIRRLSSPNVFGFFRHCCVS